MDPFWTLYESVCYQGSVDNVSYDATTDNGVKDLSLILTPTRIFTWVLFIVDSTYGFFFFFFVNTPVLKYSLIIEHKYPHMQII